MVSIILLLTAGFVLLLDQSSKVLIRRILSPGQSITFLKFFRITVVENPGAAFGLLPHHQLIFLITTLVAIIFIIVYYRQLKPQERAVKLALGLELGGAMGNLTDRLFFGRVTDFIDFRIWPVFNVADIAIILGLLVLGWAIIGSYGKGEWIGIEKQDRGESEGSQ